MARRRNQPLLKLDEEVIEETLEDISDRDISSLPVDSQEVVQLMQETENSISEFIKMEEEFQENNCQESMYSSRVMHICKVNNASVGSSGVLAKASMAALIRSCNHVLDSAQYLKTVKISKRKFL